MRGLLKKLFLLPMFVLSMTITMSLLSAELGYASGGKKDDDKKVKGKEEDPEDDPIVKTSGKVEEKVLAKLKELEDAKFAVASKDAYYKAEVVLKKEARDAMLEVFGLKVAATTTETLKLLEEGAVTGATTGESTSTEGKPSDDVKSAMTKIFKEALLDETKAKGFKVIEKLRTTWLGILADKKKFAADAKTMLAKMFEFVAKTEKDAAGEDKEKQYDEAMKLLTEHIKGLKLMFPVETWAKDKDFTVELVIELPGVKDLMFEDIADKAKLTALYKMILFGAKAEADAKAGHLYVKSAAALGTVDAVKKEVLKAGLHMVKVELGFKKSETPTLAEKVGEKVSMKMVHELLTKLVEAKVDLYKPTEAAEKADMSIGSMMEKALTYDTTDTGLISATAGALAADTAFTKDATAAPSKLVAYSLSHVSGTMMAYLFFSRPDTDVAADKTIYSGLISKIDGIKKLSLAAGANAVTASLAHVKALVGADGANYADYDTAPTQLASTAAHLSTFTVPVLTLSEVPASLVPGTAAAANGADADAADQVQLATLLRLVYVISVLPASTYLDEATPGLMFGGALKPFTMMAKMKTASYIDEMVYTIASDEGDIDAANEIGTISTAFNAAILAGAKGGIAAYGMPVEKGIILAKITP